MTPLNMITFNLIAFLLDTAILINELLISLDVNTFILPNHFKFDTFLSDHFFSPNPIQPNSSQFNPIQPNSTQFNPIQPKSTQVIKENTELEEWLLVRRILLHLVQEVKQKSRPLKVERT